MRFGDLLSFKKDIFFDGAVQIDWFYEKNKAQLVSENFVFHGKEYHGGTEFSAESKLTDTIQFVYDISQKINEENGTNPFTLAIAGYGTGKSHLAVTMATLFSGEEFLPNSYHKIIKNISTIDNKKGQLIYENTQKSNLVIVLNGMRDFNLHYELLRAAQKSLELYGCSDDKLRKIDRAAVIAYRFFERNKTTSLLLFEKYAKENGINLSGTELTDFIQYELGKNEIAFNIVNDVYNEINGDYIRWDEGVSATAILETLSEEYCGLSGPFNNIIIIFDEFGRYLEYASDTSTAKSGDSALQQIFECAQNAGGSIQLISLIQSDIKSYLQRIDKTSNISRYIGRYEASDKYYLSSNLETIFANLIHRKDAVAYQKIIKNWLNQRDSEWQDIFNHLNVWVKTKGIWGNYEKFRNVVVNGIYPLHPISTYMLSQLADYLQNRSSLILVNSYFNEFADKDIEEGSSLPYVYPESLLKGDLYTEILDAEEKGRQLTQYCIQFNNIKRKYEDKLVENTMKVLRANLVLRILRFKTRTYDDAKNALAICSGLSANEIDEALSWLENQYAILAYDEYAGCFDFLENSSGAHDFKIFYNREKSKGNFNKSVFEDTTIRDLADVINLQATNFATIRKIKTNEWYFEQEMFPIEEISEGFIDGCLKDWQTAITPEKAKGKLIWLYINKDVETEFLETAQNLSKKLVNTPIVLMLLNDVEDKLKSALMDYNALQGFKDTDKEKFGRHYDNELLKVKEAIRNIFYLLRGERYHITENGIVKQPKRLGLFLTDVFNSVYSKAVPFDFEGFDSKQAGKARQAFSTIVKMLLTGNVQGNSIQSLPVDIRNRFEATLFVRASNASWRCISNNFQLCEPQQEDAQYVYKYIVNKIEADNYLACKDIFNELVKPPYGMNSYAVLYMLSVVISNLQYCLRLELNNVKYSATVWKDKLFVEKKSRVEFDQNLIFQTIIRKINPDGINSVFISLFNKIDNNTNILAVDELQKELDKLLATEELSDELNARYQLSLLHISDGKHILNRWEQNLETIMKKYDSLLARKDVYSGLRAIIELEDEVGLFSCFSCTKYGVPAQFRDDVKKQCNIIRKTVEPLLIDYIKGQKCKSVADINTFKGHMDRIIALLAKSRYLEERNFAEKHKDDESGNKQRINERQTLLSDISAFQQNVEIKVYTPYTTLKAWEEEGIKLLNKIKEYYQYLSNPKQLNDQISNIVKEITLKKKEVDDLENKIYDEFYNLDSIQSIKNLITLIQSVYSKGIAEKDLDDFRAMDKTLQELLDKIEQLNHMKNDRYEFSRLSKEIILEYENIENDFDAVSIIDNIVLDAVEAMNRQELQWITKYLDSQVSEKIAMMSWLKETELLPKYLSEDTVARYVQEKNRINKVLDTFAIDDIVFKFKQLKDVQQKECLIKLNDIVIK